MADNALARALVLYNSKPQKSVNALPLYGAMSNTGGGAPSIANQLARALMNVPHAIGQAFQGNSYGSADPNNAVADAARQQFWRGSVFGVPEDVTQRNLQRATNIALAAPTLWHGGELVAKPSGFNQGSVIDGVPSVSTAPTALGAARYAIHNRGSLNAIDSTNMKIYTKGTNQALDDAYNAADFGKLKAAGFDGMDLRSFGHGSEVVIFDPAVALKNKVGEAQMANRVFGGRFFDQLIPSMERK